MWLYSHKGRGVKVQTATRTPTIYYAMFLPMPDTSGIPCGTPMDQRRLTENFGIGTSYYLKLTKIQIPGTYQPVLSSERPHGWKDPNQRKWMLPLCIGKYSKDAAMMLSKKWRWCLIPLPSLSPHWLLSQCIQGSLHSAGQRVHGGVQERRRDRGPSTVTVKDWGGAVGTVRTE